MAPLPGVRVQPRLPFEATGVDYASPIWLRTRRGRGFKSYKGYICLFICLSTKALHLEAVTDLTSSAFIAAFKRFACRRGRCSIIMSDNGTTFRGVEGTAPNVSRSVRLLQRVSGTVSQPRNGLVLHSTVLTQLRRSVEG